MNKTKKIVFLINICHQGKPNKINYEIKKKRKKMEWIWKSYFICMQNSWDTILI